MNHNASTPPQNGHTPTIALPLWIAVGLLVLIAASHALAHLRPPRWEYRIESPSDLTFDLEMRELGAEGWELVTARRATSAGTDGAAYEMIFKRQRP